MARRASGDGSGEDEEWTDESDDNDEVLGNQQRDIAERNVETMEQTEGGRSGTWRRARGDGPVR